MTIRCGSGTAGKSGAKLRLTLSGQELDSFRRRYSDTQRFTWRIQPLDRNRWLVVFTPSSQGNKPVLKHLATNFAGPSKDKTPYLCWAWGLPIGVAEKIPGIAKRRVVDMTFGVQGELMVTLQGYPPAEIVPSVKSRGHKSPRRAKTGPEPSTVPPQAGPSLPATNRLSALRESLNHAIREMRGQGHKVRVSQAVHGEDVTISIDL